MVSRDTVGRIVLRGSNNSERGDTLIEILIALLVLGIASVAILLAFATTISGSAEHRSITTVDTVLRSAASEATSQLQQQSSASWTNCTGASQVTFVNVPAHYMVAISAVSYWNGTTFVAATSTSSPSFSSPCAPNAAQLVTITVTTLNNYSYNISTVVDDPQARPVQVGVTPTKLVFLGTIGTGQSGSALSPPPVVALEDSSGRIVTSDLSPVNLTLTASNGATLSNNCSGSEFYGVVTFSNCSINTAGSGYTLTATDGSLPSITSNSFAVLPASPAQLVFTPVNPGPGIAGSPIPNLSVQVEDSFGNLVTSATGAVTLSVNSGSAQSGFTSGTASVTVSGGTATFTSLVLDTAGSYTLTATPVGISGLTATNSSVAFTVAPGAASLFAVVNPNSQTAGTPFSDTITAYDAYGNLVTSYTGSKPVVFSGPSNSPNGSSPTYPATVSFSSGVGIATGITLVDVQQTTLTATQGTVSGVSGSFTVSVSATATQFTVANPGTQTAGMAFSETLTATDSFGNTITGFAGAKTIAFSGPSNSPGSSAPSYPTSVLFAAGTGSAPITLVDAQATTLTATLGAVSGTSGSFTVGSAGGNKLVFSPATPGPGTAGGPIPNLAVQADDPYGNVAVSASGSVTLSIKTGSPQATFTSGTPSVALNAGTATFTTLVVTASGTYALAATPVGIVGVTGVATSNGFVVNVLPNITTTSLPAATKTGMYAQTLSVSGGTGPYTWSLASGSLPAGLTLNASTGVVSGTVSASAASQNFTAEVTDANGVTDTQALTIVVDTVVNITTTTLPDSTRTGAYSQPLSLSGGTAPYTWSLASGPLPSGLTLSASTGVISGTVANGAVSETFTAQVTDADGVTDTQQLTIAVNAAISITTTSVPDATKTGSYSQTLAVSGGTTLFRWSLASGTLPSGLTLGASTGVISGTVSSGAISENFTVQVTDANNVTDTQALAITVNSVPSITTTTLPGATRTGAYSQTLGVSGGTPAYTWSVSSGSLPSGLTLGASTGVISGTVGSLATGQTFTVKAIDADGVNDTQVLVLAVNVAPNIVTTSLPAGTRTGNYSQTLSVSGGTAPYAWSLLSGSLPTGITRDAAAGTIYGTVGSSASTTTFVAEVTDANGVTDTQSLTFTVNAAPNITTTTLPGGI